MTSKAVSVPQELQELPFHTNSAVQPGKINLARITAVVNGKPITKDVTGAISEIYYYESILDNTISATMMLVDSGYELPPGSRKTESNSLKTLDGLQSTSGIINELQITGGERVDFEIQDENLFSGKQKIKMAGRTQMYINRVRDLTNSGLKDVYALDLVPPEYITNELTRVTGRYEGKPDQHVIQILGGIVKARGTYDVDGTFYHYNFIGNNKKPLHVCTWLAAKSSPDPSSTNGKTTDGGAAGFFFYQTRDGFHFKSIDKFLDKTFIRIGVDSEGREFPIRNEKIVRREFIYNNTGKAAVRRNTPGDNFNDSPNILAYTVKKAVDVGKDLAMGTYNNVTSFFDFYSMNYIHRPYKVDPEKLNPFAKISLPEETVISSPSRYMTRVLDVGVMPDGGNLEAWKAAKEAQNYKADKIMVQSLMRYNQLFSLQVKITIAGDFDLRAGDIVECRFMDLNLNKEQNLELSGPYLIANICHRLTANDTFTTMDLVRDSTKFEKFATKEETDDFIRRTEAQ